MAKNQEIVTLNNYVDFTLIDARATDADLEKLCDIAYKNQYYSVCVNPCNVRYASGYIKSKLNGALKVSVVIGFPLGASRLDVKVLESKLALQDGADEIAFVVNIGKVKKGDFGYVKEEILKLRKITKGAVLKCVIETCYLTENEIVKLCNICAKSKVDFVETSTGFGVGGASKEVVKLLCEVLAGRCKVKASGGVRIREQAVEFVNIGAERVGTSRIL